MTAKSHPAAMHFIPDQLPREFALRSDISSSHDLLTREPARYVLTFSVFLSDTFGTFVLAVDSFCSFRCLILRMNGELSLLDLDDGREIELTHSVELFWVTCGQSEEKTNLIEEVSWLDYGHRGMQVTVSIAITFLYG